MLIPPPQGVRDWLFHPEHPPCGKLQVCPVSYMVEDSSKHNGCITEGVDFGAAVWDIRALHVLILRFLGVLWEALFHNWASEDS